MGNGEQSCAVAKTTCCWMPCFHSVTNVLCKSRRPCADAAMQPLHPPFSSSLLRPCAIPWCEEVPRKNAGGKHSLAYLETCCWQNSLDMPSTNMERGTHTYACRQSRICPASTAHMKSRWSPCGSGTLLSPCTRRHRSHGHGRGSLGPLGKLKGWKRKVSL